MKFLCPCGNLFDPKVGKDGSIRIVCTRCAIAIAVRNRRSQMSALQTIAAGRKEEAAFARTGPQWGT